MLAALRYMYINVGCVYRVTGKSEIQHVFIEPIMLLQIVASSYIKPDDGNNFPPCISLHWSVRTNKNVQMLRKCDVIFGQSVRKVEPIGPFDRFVHRPYAYYSTMRTLYAYTHMISDKTNKNTSMEQHRHIAFRLHLYSSSWTTACLGQPELNNMTVYSVWSKLLNIYLYSNGRNLSFNLIIYILLYLQMPIKKNTIWEKKKMNILSKS